MGNLLADQMTFLGWLGLVLAIITLLSQIVQAFVVNSVNNRTKQIDTLTSDAKAAANEVINVRFAAFDKAQDEVQRRLERGDGSFDRLEERAREIERELMTKVDQIKDFMRDNCASKGDVEHLNDRLDQIITGMAERRS